MAWKCEKCGEVWSNPLKGVFWQSFKLWEAYHHNKCGGKIIRVKEVGTNA